jgi:serine O-acetyltransferase
MKREKYFKKDLERFYIIRSYKNQSQYRKLRFILSDSGIHYVAIYRLNQYTQSKYHKNKLLGFPLYLIAHVIFKISGMIYNIHIESYEDFGPGLFIAHPSCIFIGGKIGKNCILHQFTTIGWGYSDGKYGTPEIGDNVWIGPNVVISGKIIIGSNSTIAAGAVVTKDVPEKALVIGNPARIVSTDYDNSLLYIDK